MHNLPRGARVVVAMSGGVDSSVAAALLQADGYDVVGISLQTHSLEADSTRRFGGCCSIADLRDARRVAEHLGLPHYVLNITGEFRAAVIDEFIDEYLAGRTPNPCVRCNQRIKFDLLLQRATTIGAVAVVTGHYARRSWDAVVGCYALHRGRDRRKDQSYVLFNLDQQQLAGLRFPLGAYAKEEVRALAAEFGLPVAEKPESQEICFVPENDYAAWLQRQVPERLPGAGEIVDETGRLLGRHRGVPFYTVGQRHGLGLAAARPFYVQRLEPQRNRLVVAQHDVLARRCRLRDVTWLAPLQTLLQTVVSNDGLPTEARRCRAEVQIRSRHAAATAAIELLPAARQATAAGGTSRAAAVDEPSDGARAWPQGGPQAWQGGWVTVAFDEPQRAITPGQAAVFYAGDRVLGGGWIDAVLA